MPRKKPKAPIHPTIKKRLGYRLDESDSDILADWSERLSRVCKPCWELKYCPYGPLVEQSPLLPPTRSSMIEHHKYYEEALKTGYLGGVSPLDQDTREIYERVLEDEDMLIRRAFFELDQQARVEHAAKAEDPVETFRSGFSGDLPPIHEYRVKYDETETPELALDKLEADVRSKVEPLIEADRNRLREALKTGIDDHRQPIDPVRKAMFEKEISEFSPEYYPDDVPEIFQDGECSIFGHICPVFFAAEAMTETSEERRRGRYIPFKVKMRVVRRDNYTCQHCSVHLQDDEVEFDHKIPVARGGSSEEHNIRLTCFDCNREKSDHVDI